MLYVSGPDVASYNDSNMMSGNNSWASTACLFCCNSICGTSALSVLHVCIREVTHVQQGPVCLILHVVFA